jgi:hypothetical protein
MVLSDNGDHPMTRLTDTQAVILSAASQRDDGAILPLPETLKIKGGAVDKVLGSLKAKGLIDHQGAPRGDDPPPLRITRAGLEAIGFEPEDTGSNTAPAEAIRAQRRPMPVSRRLKPRPKRPKPTVRPRRPSARPRRRRPRRARLHRPISPRRAPAPSRRS